MTVFAASDFHLGHRNILTYSPSRGAWASTIEEHDRMLIEAWRATVQPDDVVIFCGDWALVSMKRMKEIAPMFTGKIDLLLGNHDRSDTSMRSLGCFRSVQYRLDVVVQDVGRVVARHRPQDFTLEDARAAHIHGSVGAADGPVSVPAQRRGCCECQPSSRSGYDVSVPAQRRGCCEIFALGERHEVLGMFQCQRNGVVVARRKRAIRRSRRT
jgi:calcineurin-like phosphoesterase family protein